MVATRVAYQVECGLSDREVPLSRSRPPAVYRLQALLELRKRALDERRLALARSVAQEDEAARALQQAERGFCEQKERIEDRRRARSVGAVRADGLVAERNFDQVLTQRLQQSEAELQRARDEHATCQATASQALSAVRAAEAGVRAVESHKDQWRRARAADSDRRAEAELDDVVAARYEAQSPHEGGDDGADTEGLN